MFNRTHLVLALALLVGVGLLALALGAMPVRAAGLTCDGTGCYYLHTTTNDFVRGQFYATGLRQLGDGEVQLLPVGLSTPWQATTELPDELAELALVSSNNILYAIGGFDGNLYRTEIYSATTSTVGDITLGWAVADNLPEARAGAAAVVANVPDPVLYVVGGGQGAGTNTIYYKKFGTGGTLPGNWSTKTLPENRIYSVAVARGNNLYVVGGTEVGTSTIYRIPITNANGDLGTVEQDLSLPEELTILGAVTWEGETAGFLYTLGGLNTAQESSEDVYFTRFNQDGTLNNEGPVLPGWENTSLVDAFNAHGAIQYNGAIFVIGGRQGISSSDAVTKVQTALIDLDGSLHNWGPGIGSWIVTEPLPEPRFFHGSTSNDGGELFIAGGYDDDFNPTKTVYHGSTTGAASTYAPYGEFVSDPFDAGINAKMEGIQWNATVEDTATQGLEMFYRTSNNLVDLAQQDWTSAGMSIESAVGATNTLTFPAVLTRRYLQYRAIFTTSVPDVSPQLNTVRLDLFDPPTPTPTATSTQTASPTVTGTATNTPTATVTDIVTDTPTATATNTPTRTATATASNTPCSGKPEMASLVAPNNKSKLKGKKKVMLGWDAAPCAQKYKLILKQDKKKSKAIQRKKNITTTETRTKKLKVDHSYFWRIQSCNSVGCAKWSKWWKFKITPKGELIDAGPDTELNE